MSRDEVLAGEKWNFDAEVTAVFSDMLARSIPLYRPMRSAVTKLAERYMRSEGSIILDLGCSEGDAIADLVPMGDGFQFVGVDVSEPMLQSATKRFMSYDNVLISRCDLRSHFPATAGSCSVILSILTLQFVPIEYRLRILADIHRALMPGAAFIFVEKVIGNTAGIDKDMIDIYLDMKRENGYSDDQIERKRLSLEGVLVPLTDRSNRIMIESAGFRDIDCFFRWMNFSGYIAVKL